MIFEHSSIEISLICAAILGLILFVNHYFKLKNLRIELSKFKNRCAEIVHKVKDNELRLAQEKEKLLMHTQVSAEGVCFFRPNRTVALYNGFFLQYFNMISHNSISMNREMIEDKVFEPVLAFLDSKDHGNYFETLINGQGNEFSLRVNVFADESFEIILADVTSKEKMKRLKQEMTSNIAHELKTPVTSIRGFLEIVLNNNISEEKKKEYLERAFHQTQTLTELIADMSLLTRMDERAESLRLSIVNASELLKRLQSDMEIPLSEKNIKFNSEVPANVFLKGNENLIYSIFRNLTDNVIRYAGENLDINIKIYEIKDSMVYFIFSDTGKGVEKYIPLERLFERFYRVDEGRTRGSGGSGLGLSIVKNAVMFHKGSISVSNGSAGGLEFMFSLPV